MPSISASSYAKWHSCNRLYYYEYVLYLERVRQDGARALGTMIHAGLEAWWRVAGDDAPWKEVDAALVAALAAIADHSKHINTDPLDTAKSESLLIVYHTRYATTLRFEPAYDGVESVEVAFNLPLLDPWGKEVDGWRLSGRKDAIKRFADKRVRPVEHKSTTTKINAGSDYWKRLGLATQVSIYIDAAQRTGHPECDEAHYDVLRKPGLERQLATPIEKHRMTKGKGCTTCGGRAGGKLGVAQGTGEIMTLVDGTPTKTECTVCGGSGWKPGEVPRLHADIRLTDEPLEEYRERLLEELGSDPDSYFRQARIPRTRDQLMDARADLVTTVGIIGAMRSLAVKRSSGNLDEVDARDCYPRNDQACLNQYGRACDMLPICTGEIPNPMKSPLYQIKKKGGPK